MRQETMDVLQAGTSEERAKLILSFDADTLKTVKREIVTEMGLGIKPVDPEVANLQARIAEFEKDQRVMDYLECVTELKKRRGRKITPGLPKYQHDEGYGIVQVQDGTLLDTTMQGWQASMDSLGYSKGQVAMVSKGKRQAKDGQIFKNTIVESTQNQ